MEIVITIWWVAQVLEMRGIDPRTSRMLSELSTIWATSQWFKTVEESFVSVGEQEAKFFLEGVSCIRLQYSVVFWRKLINCSMSLTSEMRGIAPRTSDLISGRSTIWPTSHVYQISRTFFSLSQQLWTFSFRSQKIHLLGISICKRLSGDSDYNLMSDSSFGDAGHRSQYFSHAKRALYHLSYIPIIYNCRGSFCFSRQTRGYKFSGRVFLV